jgi:hypothetical protein
MRFDDAGYFASLAAGRIGLGEKLPPQLGQTPPSSEATHALQKVHSNVQIIASGESGGRSRPQLSQSGRSSSIG